MDTLRDLLCAEFRKALCEPETRSKEEIAYTLAWLAIQVIEDYKVLQEIGTVD